MRLSLIDKQVQTENLCTKLTILTCRTTISLKDIVMIPSPSIDAVPGGWKREELYYKKLAVSAVEISEGMSEKEIRQKLNHVFREKIITSIPEAKYRFVRAVGNKIIDPDCQCYDGKVTKHLSKQGPVYISTVQDITSDVELWQELKAESDESDNSDNCEVPVPKAEKLKNDSDDDILLVSAFSPDDNAASQVINDTNTCSHQSNCTITAVMVRCPTCNLSFSTEVAEHADRCADAAEGVLHSRITYGNLVMQDGVDMPRIVSNITSNDNSGLTLLDCLTTLIGKVHKETSRIYVRRKRLWEDFIHVTKSCSLIIIFR